MDNLKPMNEFSSDPKGFLYILGVRDIDLPVCKIGMTSRKPAARCAEINHSSTGDFIWELVHQFYVNDCKKLESLVHEKLQPLRQRNREFFNIHPEDAIRAVISIMSKQQDLAEIPPQEIGFQNITNNTMNKRTNRKYARKNVDSKYVQILDTFTELLNVKGRPFGQLNKSVFGISDGREGVQWNVAIYPEKYECRVGVNLEGMKYVNWPIASLIMAELKTPTIFTLIPLLRDPEHIVVQFLRDAWQVNSRPNILEQFLGGREFTMSELKADLWQETLNQALACLNIDRGYRGRARQDVTLAAKPRSGPQKRTMEVSPHLNIWTPVEITNFSKDDLAIAIERLTPVHNWVSQLCL